MMMLPNAKVAGLHRLAVPHGAGMEQSTAALAVCMVCDFFYPNAGGVESHLFQLSQCLIDRGHRVVIVTHAYGKRAGVRHLTRGLKVYYLPFPVFLSQCVLPNVLLTFPLLRWIFVREGIDVVHGHSAFSTLCHDAIMHARTMGLPAVFTDHSLFGFAEMSSVLTNKFLEFTLSDVSHVICVSHTSRENTVLRARVPPALVSVIPNAVDATVFAECRAAPGRDWVTVVVVSRLVARKGTDLLASIIPEACARHPTLRFVIGGDGPRRIVLEEARERYRLQDRVELLGAVRHDAVRSVLVRGDIFLNTSLTEAFCIAIVEAACCGLAVVSTNVGGIPEVLPPALVKLADADAPSMLDALDQAILDLGRSSSATDKVRSAALDAVRTTYNWHRIAERTEHVYRRVMTAEPPTVQDRVLGFLSCGPVAGPIFVCVLVLDVLLFWVLERLQPRRVVDAVKRPSRVT